MKRITILAICFCVLVMFLASIINITAHEHGANVEHNSKLEKNWHYWRGPTSNGTAVNANPPITWSATENIRWKTPIPGYGHATPIIWEDKIFIQTAIEIASTQMEEETEETEEQSRNNRRRRNRNLTTLKYDLLAINRADGSIIWQETLKETKPHEGIHLHASFASNSPITDGEHVYAYFGSRGLYCLDMDGNKKWEKDIGQMRKAGTFGEGSCPVIHGNVIIVLQDHQGQSFIVALDKRTGDELWKMDREEPTTWTSPVVIDYKGISQVIVPATKRTRSYDLSNGEIVWECGGMTRNVVPSPLYMDGHVYVISGHGGSSLQSINLELASGDITDTEAVDWQYDQDTSYVPSPVLIGDVIYFLKRNGNILTAIDRNSGEVLYGPERVKGISNVYASIVGTSDRLYIASRNGTTAVLKHGPSLEVLALNILDDSFNASPALIGSEIYLRGSEYLYCIAE